jgi:hypothetical protein
MASVLLEGAAMSSSTSAAAVALSVRQAPATEKDFAAFLRDSQPKEELWDLFARF